MSGTLMDTNPLPPAPSEQLPTSPSDAVSPDLPVPSFYARPQGENPLLDIFLGPHGLYPGTRWLIYLALCGIVLGVFGAIRHYVHAPRGGSIWWGLLPQASVVIAVILPGLVMALGENRPFGDFGLPARTAFPRNFWLASLSAIFSLRV